MPADANKNPSKVVGRGAQVNPPNRFERISVENDFEHLDYDDDLGSPKRLETEYFDDDSKSIVSENSSPDIPFRFSLNPYRGCLHGCTYCYARPTHEYLSLSAGTDFESKIFVKQRAPQLLREFLSRSKWQCESIILSGVTDCYQPAERRFELTRRCLEVALEFRQPLSLVTKNALVVRDLDLLAEMAGRNLVRVALSLTSLDQSLTRRMEPRTSSPAAKLDAISQLSAASVPVTVMVAPIIPGLNDSEIPTLLQAAKQHGARYAGYVLLRLPLTVAPIFGQWLEHNEPDRHQKVLSLIRQTRDGNLNQSQFGERMRGTGAFAEHLFNTFTLFARHSGLETQPPPLDCTQFRIPAAKPRQLELF